ncbi:MAG: thiamine pyrophosphate-dependent enzyme, partial [Chitinophagales bacterium]
GKEQSKEDQLSYKAFKAQVLEDYKLSCESREASLMGRKEVLTGKAKFGIFGDGKEVAQIALAKNFKPGDFRSGYYRDQTIMFAAGITNTQEFFAQLYANTNLEEEPASAGRQMNAHFATRSLDENGNWKDLVNMKNSSADCSPTASQMARAVGLAMASKKYRENPKIKEAEKFSRNGDEVCFCTIGDASTSEGLFWEAINAAGVTKIPMVVSIWDDGYGISVSNEYQTTKGDIGEVLKGFASDKKNEGIDIYTVNGWDYASLCEAYEKGVEKVRESHRPAIFHIKEMTQPQGHSTSGSHERYKSKERLEWEAEHDCIQKMREWIVDSALAKADALDEIEKKAKADALDAKKAAWKSFQNAIKKDVNEAGQLLKEAAESTGNKQIAQVALTLKNQMDPIRKDALLSIKHAIWALRHEDHPVKEKLLLKKEQWEQGNSERYNSHLYSQSDENALDVPVVPAEYADDTPEINGYEILNKAFDAMLENDSRVFAFGEDLGKIGGVNQAFAGLQEKYGEERVFDTGIREATIIGQGIGMAMRGLRPIAEIQYLDYVIYGLQPLTDDLACLQYRSKGGQKAPLIVRTRGHRFEGIWHTGSPIGMILNAIRGMRFCVPRNMTQAAGMYNTLLQSDEPGLLIECLNGYRLKEKLPSNLGEMTVPLGVPEVLHEGNDISLVTYGSCVRVAEEAILLLDQAGISVELIDVQTLLPFDRHELILESIKKTNRVIFLDEDVPGGASAYMMQQVLDKQKAYLYLDSA